MKLIVTCGCSDTDSFAKDAFRLIFPNEELPGIISQNHQNCDFGKWTPEVRALAKTDAKFAYYLTDTEMWDLKKGIRLA